MTVNKEVHKNGTPSRQHHKTEIGLQAENRLIDYRKSLSLLFAPYVHRVFFSLPQVRA